MLAELIEAAKRKVLAVISRRPDEPEDPDDPFAMVGARVKPRRPLNRSSIAIEPEQ